MPKLKFLNANGDFVLTDADQAAETYFPLANEGGIISSITPRLAGDCKTGQDTFLLAACSEQTPRTKAVRRAISGCNLPTERCGAPPGKKRGPAGGARFGKGADEVMLYGGLLWQTVERANRALGVKAAVTRLCLPAGHGGADACHRDKPLRRSAYLYPPRRQCRCMGAAPTTSATTAM